MRHSTVQKLLFSFELLIVITFLSAQDANAGWWSSGQIDDKTFAMAIQYLIESGIVKV